MRWCVQVLLAHRSTASILNIWPLPRRLVMLPTFDQPSGPIFPVQYRSDSDSVVMNHRRFDPHASTSLLLTPSQKPFAGVEHMEGAVTVVSPDAQRRNVTFFR